MWYLIVLLVFLLLFLITQRNDVENFDGLYNIKIQRKYPDKENAAALLEKAMHGLITLRTHLNDKYAAFEQNQKKIGSDVYLIDDIRQMIDRVNRKFNPNNTVEVDPKNSNNDTSFVISKGKKMGVCVRNKQGELHDINTLMFVVIHEFSHIATKDHNHVDIFWKNFKFMLHEAIEAGIYKPIDYAKHVTSYCGIDIYYNPYYINKV